MSKYFIWAYGRLPFFALKERLAYRWPCASLCVIFVCVVVIKSILAGRNMADNLEHFNPYDVYVERHEEPELYAGASGDSHPVLQLGGLTTEEIVELHRDAHRAPDPNSDLSYDLEVGFGNGMVALCAEHPEVAAAVLTLLADSDDEKELTTATSYLDDLAASNPGPAYNLFAQLLQHPNEQIRHYARGTLGDAVGKGAISLQKAAELLRLFRQTEGKAG